MGRQKLRSGPFYPQTRETPNITSFLLYTEYNIIQSFLILNAHQFTMKWAFNNRFIYNTNYFTKI